MNDALIRRYDKNGILTIDHKSKVGKVRILASASYFFVRYYGADNLSSKIGVAHYSKANEKRMLQDVAAFFDTQPGRTKPH